MIANDGLYRVWMEAVIICFRVLPNICLDELKTTNLTAGPRPIKD
jgi:hypothetical protein